MYPLVLTALGLDAALLAWMFCEMRHAPVLDDLDETGDDVLGPSSSEAAVRL